MPCLALHCTKMRAYSNHVSCSLWQTVCWQQPAELMFPLLLATKLYCIWADCSELCVVQMMTSKMGERDSKEEILKAFRLFDDDETGKISFKNLKRVAKELGENMTDEELQVQAACPSRGQKTCYRALGLE